MSELREKQLRRNLAYQTTYQTYANPFHPLWETSADKVNMIQALIPNGDNINYFEGDAYNYRANNMNLTRAAQMQNYDAFKPRKIIPGDLNFNVTNVPTGKVRNGFNTQTVYFGYTLTALLAVVLFSL